MTVISRRVIATPVRSASGAWSAIVDLVAPTDGPARQELQRIEGVASCVIAEEALKADACVIYGAGPRVRVYCLYDEDAITGGDASEGRLSHCPTDGDWHMSLPCPTDDLEWVQASLKERSAHVTARAVGAVVDEGESDKSTSATKGAVINTEAFLRS